MSARILVGDALTMLRTLDAGSVQVCVTSPPYFGLRDYGAAGQMGLEPTPAEFISKLVAVFDEVKRVLRPDGLCFVNLGDSYAGSGKGPTGGNGIGDQESRQGFAGGRGATSQVWRGDPAGRDSQTRTGPVQGIPAKNLLLIPERFAIAMQDAGWVVRSRIAWCKKSAMPESVRDRPTSAWEPIFMFAKQARYFYDADAVRQGETRQVKGAFRVGGVYTHDQAFDNASPVRPTDSSTHTVDGGANLRNVWHLGPEPSSLNHYAAFVTEIPKRCILAGTSEKGACPACGAPWVRAVEREGNWQERKAAGAMRGVVPIDKRPSHGAGVTHDLISRAVRVLGWAPSCTCPPANPVPCVVLDPFLGSGTTALVADQLGRDAVGIELSPTYAAMAEQRIAGDCPMFTNVEVIHGTPRDMMGQHDDAASGPPGGPRSPTDRRVPELGG